MWIVLAKAQMAENTPSTSKEKRTSLGASSDGLVNQVRTGWHIVSSLSNTATLHTFVQDG